MTVEQWCDTKGISKSNYYYRLRRIRKEQVRLLKEIPSVENLWQAVIAFQDYPFKTATGLPFRYKLKVGKNGEYKQEAIMYSSFYLTYVLERLRQLGPFPKSEELDSLLPWAEELPEEIETKTKPKK